MDTIQDKIDELYLNGNILHPEVHHKMPIEYVDYHTLDPIIRGDLEIGDVNPLYKYLVHPDSSLMTKWCSLYTTDTRFFKTNSEMYQEIQS